MANKTSQHILNTAANLLGFCLFVITSIHISNKAKNTYIDEFTSIIALALTISTVCSFISIRTKNPSRESKFEKLADILFVSSLLGVFVIICIITAKFWT